MSERFTDLVEVFKARQAELAGQVKIEPLREIPRYIAGADCAFAKADNLVYAVALIWDRTENRVVDLARVTAELKVPYVPGFLSFREGPALHSAIAKLKHPWDAILFDGQGLAHPRRCGLASHMGVELGAISVGAAKSLYVGTFTDPGIEQGEQTDLMYCNEIVGTVLRTKRNVRPMFISIGNRIDLEGAKKLVLACCTKFRMPEPTRLADIEVTKKLRDD